MDQGSSGLGATGRLFQSRGNSQLLTQTQAFNMKQPSALRDFGAMSHMSESADELASQQDGMAQNNPYYDDPNNINLPKLINNQSQRGGSQLLQKPTDPRDFQSSQYSQQNRSQMSHGGMPVNQTYIDLMIHDGIQKQNMQMNSQITKTINIIRKDPKLLHQVQSHLQVYQEDRIKKSYEDGVNATNIAKMRVREQVRLTNEEEEQGIENLIKQQTDAIHAKNLERLLTKNWSEIPNSYILLSKIKRFSKTEDRVNNLL